MSTKNKLRAPLDLWTAGHLHYYTNSRAQTKQQHRRFVKAPEASSICFHVCRSEPVNLSCCRLEEAELQRCDVAAEQPLGYIWLISSALPQRGLDQPQQAEMSEIYSGVILCNQITLQLHPLYSTSQADPSLFPGAGTQDWLSDPRSLLLSKANGDLESQGADLCLAPGVLRRGFWSMQDSVFGF